MSWNGRVRLSFGKREYPVLSILVIMSLILLAPFVSLYLNYVAFVICLYRVVRYDAKVFAVDYCIMAPTSVFFCTTDQMSLLIWLCLLAGIWYFVKGKVRRDGALVCLLLLVNYLLTRMQMNINDFVLCFGQMFVLYVLLSKQGAVSAERAIKAFCWSLLITSIYALVFRNSPQIVAIRRPESFVYLGITVPRFSGLIRDPNYYMTMPIVALAALCKLKETGRITSAFFWCFGVALTLFGVISYSKTFFLILVLLVVLYIFLQFRNRRVFKGMFFVLAAVLVGSYLLFGEDSPFSIVLERLTGADNLSELTTGRSDLFVRYWNAITDNAFHFLFGYGLNAPVLDKGAHNIFLEITYYFGVVGLVLMIAFYGNMLRGRGEKASKGTKQGFLSKYIVFLLLLVEYCTLQGIFQMITYVGIFIAFLSIYITPKNTEDRNPEMYYNDR